MSKKRKLSAEGCGKVVKTPKIVGKITQISDCTMGIGSHAYIRCIPLIQWSRGGYHFWAIFSSAMVFLPPSGPAECDPEVSSSSEFDSASAAAAKSPSNRLTLDRFLQSTQQVPDYFLELLVLTRSYLILPGFCKEIIKFKLSFFSQSLF